MFRVIELGTKAMQNCRSVVQMSQIVIPMEIMTAVTTACQEYGIPLMDVAARFFETIDHRLQDIMCNSS